MGGRSSQGTPRSQPLLGDSRPPTPGSSWSAQEAMDRQVTQKQDRRRQSLADSAAGIPTPHARSFQARRSETREALREFCETWGRKPWLAPLCSVSLTTLVLFCGMLADWLGHDNCSMSWTYVSCSISNRPIELTIYLVGVALITPLFWLHIFTTWFTLRQDEPSPTPKVDVAVLLSGFLTPFWMIFLAMFNDWSRYGFHLAFVGLFYFGAEMFGFGLLYAEHVRGRDRNRRWRTSLLLISIPLVLYIVIAHHVCPPSEEAGFYGWSRSSEGCRRAHMAGALLQYLALSSWALVFAMTTFDESLAGQHHHRSKSPPRQEEEMSTPREDYRSAPTGRV